MSNKRRCASCILLICGFILAGCTRKPVTEIRFLFGTQCSIVVPGSEKNARQAIAHAYARLADIDAKFNVLLSSSPMAAFNDKGIPIRDAEIIRLARRVAQVHAASGGALEPSIYPLVQLWRFYSDNPALPARRDILKLLPLVRQGTVTITDTEIRPGQKGVGLDFGAVIPGYAADEAIRMLKADGINNALVDTGGELHAMGRPARGRKWRIGVKNPRGDSIIGIIEAEDEAVSTSGDYEKYFEVNGTRYHHILNPATGYPAMGLESVTIIAPTAFAADAWSTAFFVLGKEQGFSSIASQPGMKAIVIDGQGKMFLSPAARAQYAGLPLQDAGKNVRR